MKHNVLFAAMLVGSLAFAQAPVQKPAVEAPKPSAQEPAKPEAAAEAAKPAPVVKKSRRNEDARHCLEKADNNAIIKCAEAYL